MKGRKLSSIYNIEQRMRRVFFTSSGGDKASMVKTSLQDYVLFLSGLVPLCVAVALFIRNPSIHFEPLFLTIWLICLAMFVLADIVSGTLESGLWAGYLNLSAAVVWLELGLAAALAMVIIGALITIPIRLLLGVPLRIFSGTRSVALKLTWNRISISGLSILVTAIVYELLGGIIPLHRFDPPDLLRVLMALLIGFICTQICGVLLLRNSTSAKPSLLGWQHVGQEILILLLIIAFPLIIDRVGLGVFAVIMGLLAIQSLRFHNVDAIDQSLVRRVEELSLLNNIGQVTSSNLELDDVLFNIYVQVARLMRVSVFYIALYDRGQEMLDYRLVVAAGQRIKWPARKLRDGATERVIRTKKLLRITASDRTKVADLGVFTPTSHYVTFVGMPLLVGDEVLGVMAVLSDESENAFDSNEINILQTIASQAGLAVRNALLFTQRTELVENLSRINDVVHQGLSSVDRETALTAACQTAMAITKAQKSGLFLFDAEKSRFDLAAEIGMTEAFKTTNQVMSYQPERYTMGARVVVNTDEDPRLTEYAREGEFRAFVEMPLFSSNNLISGLLAVYHNQPNYYRQVELDLLEVLANQVRAVFDNTQLFQVLELYAYEMAQLVHLSRISTASLEADKVVGNIADILRQMMNVNRVIITLIDSEEQRMRVLASVVDGDAQTSSLHNLPLEKFPELRDLVHQKTPAANAFYRTNGALSSELRALMAQDEEESLALIPIMTNGALVGALIMGSRTERHFSHHEWQFVEMAANQIAAQIKNVQLHEQTQRQLKQRLDQVSLVEEIAKQVSSSLNFNQIISNVLEAAARATQADLVLLALLTDADQFWIIIQHYANGQVYKSYSSRSKDQGIVGEVVRTGKTILLRDNNTSSTYYTDAPGLYRSSLAVPLVRGDKIIGALNVESIHESFFNEDQASFLNNLAGHAVISIENARFVEERQQEIDMLTNLRLLSLWLASADDIRSVAQAVLKTGLELMGGQGGIIFLYDSDDGDHLTVIDKLWADDRDNSQIPLNVAYRVARSGQLEIVEDITQNGTAEIESYRSLIAIPLKRGNHVHSVMVVAFATKRVFQDRDLNTIDLLASQAVGHLENATLHERIRTASDQMRAILDSTRDGMILLDSEFCLIQSNASAERLLGIHLTDYIGHYFPDMLLKHIEDERDSGYSNEEVQKMARILRLEPQLNTQRQFQHIVGNQMRYIQEIGSPVIDDENHNVGRLLVLRDVTEETELEENRELLTKMMVHDLRGPLAAIISSLQLALPSIDVENQRDEARALMQSSYKSANRLLGLVNSLLEIAAIDGPQMRLNLTPTPLSSMVETARSILESSIQQADLKVECDIPDDLPLVKVDKDKIERVLINLMDNALRYTPASGKILIAAEVVDHQVMVKIADSGPGIPRQERSRIFEKFRRVKGQNPLRGSQGNGLGLTFCKLAIEAHGGRIKVEDESPLSGACFSLTLPIA
jgi:PAS domain S-box-containing protein